MPVEIIRIFVGSPGELSEERVRLEEVVKELNLSWGNTLGLRLELVKWETDAYPGVGTDPQAVIDEQIGDEYDIFIGMLWTKFGTPTSDAASGTEHEFQRAYQRYIENPDQLRIMFYFKDGQVLPSQVDAEQLLKVAQFKKQLGELGSFYWMYKTSDEFVNFTRIHLTKQIQSWRKKWGPSYAPRLPLKDRTAGRDQGPVEAASELGFLDLLEASEEGFQAMVEVMQQMGTAVEMLGQKITQRTSEINQGHAMDQSSKIRHWKRVANALADDMQDFCAATEAEIPVFGKLYRQSTSALARAVSMSQEFGGNQGEQVEGVLAQMRLLGGGWIK